MRDIYADITNTIIEALETASGTFQMPWHRTKGDLPTNALTKNHYQGSNWQNSNWQGSNWLVLWIAGDKRKYASNEWATYKQ